MLHNLPQIPYRTCRIDSIEKNGLEFAKNLGIQNVRDLCKLIQVCAVTNPAVILC